MASFGGLRRVAWRSNVRLECRAVGIPEPQRQWLVIDIPINRLHPSRQARLAVAPDGALLLSSAQRSDQGDYTCVVSNEHGRDHITYHLLVQGKLFASWLQQGNCKKWQFNSPNL